MSAVSLSAAASRESLDTLLARLNEVTGRFSTSDGLTGLARDLYGVADVLVSNVRLRRTVADPSSPPAGRSALVRTLFDKRIGASALTLAADAAGLRWSSVWALTDALELAGDSALFAAAELAGQLGEVEDELFRIGRILDGADSLVTLLDQQNVDPDRRAALLASVLAGRTRPETAALLDHAVRSTRKRSIELAIDDLLELTARRQARSVARVVSATPLSDEQEQRLAGVLSDMFGRPVSVRSAIDPAVRGGLLIRLGDEIIDGTVAARFAQARAALAQ